MRKYERRPRDVLAQKFHAPTSVGKEGSTVLESKKYLWWVTQHHSYCPTTDEYRGTTYQLCAPNVIHNGLKPGDYIIVDLDDAKVSVMSGDDFRKEYQIKPVGIMKRRK